MARMNKTQRQARLKAKIKGAGELPEGVTAVVLEPTPEGIDIMHRAIREGGTTEAVGEPSAKLVGMYEREMEEDIGETELDTEAAQMEEGEELPEDEVKEPVSIVKDRFKRRYADNAVAIGDTRKQVKRSNWDWLAQQLAAYCLNEKGKIDIGSFQDVLEANGIDHTKWANRTKGWEGRFRMTGRVALQKVVANSGWLEWPGEGAASAAPAEFCEKYKSKA